MPVSGRVGLALSGLCALLLGCASSARSGNFLLERARESSSAGDLDRALVYSESALQQDPFEPDPEEVALHIELLRRLDRSEEAAAFEEFAARYAAGEQTDSEDTVPSRDECKELARKRFQTTRLVREYGDLPMRGEFEIGVIAASYEIDAEGRPIHIRVIRAGIRRRPG